MNYYLLVKAVHVLAVVAFLGNIITGLFWMRFARKTNDIKIMLHAAKGLIASDKIFTIPGVVIITAGGFFAAIYGGVPLLRTGWIFWPIIFFSVSGFLFAFKVAPLQGKMRKDLEKNSNAIQPELKHFDLVMNKWEFWGFLATILPVISFFMMILKWPLLSPLAN